MLLFELTHSNLILLNKLRDRWGLANNHFEVTLIRSRHEIEDLLICRAVLEIRYGPALLVKNLGVGTPGLVNTITIKDELRTSQDCQRCYQ